MIVALKSGGKYIPLEKALDCIYGYGVTLDMTRRDLQAKAKEMGHPTQGAIWLGVNGERKQTGDLDQMIRKVPEMISYLSGLFTLMPGDILLSGTPSGLVPSSAAMYSAGMPTR